MDLGLDDELSTLNWKKIRKLEREEVEEKEKNFSYITIKTFLISCSHLRFSLSLLSLPHSVPSSPITNPHYPSPSSSPIIISSPSSHASNSLTPSSSPSYHTPHLSSCLNISRPNHHHHHHPHQATYFVAISSYFILFCSFLFSLVLKWILLMIYVM